MRPGPETYAMHYRGHGFSLELPDGWEDRSLFLLLGPQVGTRRPALSIVLDRINTAPSPQAYGEHLLERIQQQTSGWEVLREEPVAFADGVAGHLLEIARLPLDGARLFRRFYIRTQGGAATLVIAQLDRKLRGLRGRLIDRMGRSLRAPGNGALTGEAETPSAEMPAARAKGSGGDGIAREGEAAAGVFCAQDFDLDLPEDWTNLTEYRLVDVKPSRLQGNLVIQHEPRDETPMAADQRARAELAAMKETVPGFRLLEESETELASGQQVPRATFERTAARIGVIRQWMTFVPGRDCWYTLCLTGEGGAPPEIDASMEEILASFTTEPEQASV
ncbi:MAG: DcrB-related protein [Candidatus Eisenbacteria sp.]|nr:DcrB-related protein [Candidatus Eisenbacteria bacterium]